MLVVVFVGLSAHSFATIAKFQWFSKLPSPLNGMVEGNHWHQWYSDGFGEGQPLVTIVFDGCVPLVCQWNGYIPSSKSSPLEDRDKMLKSRGFKVIKYDILTSQLFLVNQTSPHKPMQCGRHHMYV